MRLGWDIHLKALIQLDLTNILHCFHCFHKFYPICNQTAPEIPNYQWIGDSIRKNLKQIITCHGVLFVVKLMIY